MSNHRSDAVKAHPRYLAAFERGQAEAAQLLADPSSDQAADIRQAWLNAFLESHTAPTNDAMGYVDGFTDRAGAERWTIGIARPRITGEQQL